MDVQEIIVAFKTHFDIGYTDRTEAIVQKYSSSMIAGALEVLDKTKALPSDRRFVWTLPGWPMSEILKRCDAATRPNILNAISEGWFAVHALPFTYETEPAISKLLREVSSSPLPSPGNWDYRSRAMRN
jgi:hypothetical protein